MAIVVKVRPVTAADRAEWQILWNSYCAFYQAQVPDAVTETLWGRLQDPESAVKGLVATDGDGRLLGLCHYVLHPHTWSARLLCYLEDLFTGEAARGQGVGRALITHLVAMATAADWARVYWHTDADNARARILYDKVTGGADAFVRYTIVPERPVNAGS